MARRRPVDAGNRAITRAIRDGLARGFDAGLADGLAEGLRRHVPGGVAILVIGAPACMLCAFVQFVLGVAIPATAILAVVGAAGIGGVPALLRASRRAAGESVPDDVVAGDMPPDTAPHDRPTIASRDSPRNGRP